jgi:hypothetical protein
MPPQVLDSSGSGSYSTIISGMGWVKNYVANNNIASAVVSLSISGPMSQAFNDAVQSLVNVSL